MLDSPPTPNFEIIRSDRRRRVAIRIWAGKVQLLTPRRFPEEQAKAFLAQHAGWVQKKLREQACAPACHPKEYRSGEIFLYLGEAYSLTIAYAKQPAVMLSDKQLFVFIRETGLVEKRKSQIHQQLRRWYWQQAEQQLQQKSAAYAQQLALKYQSIAIRQFKSRWGCCSIKGDIQYSWQIILAPDQIINYLVVHELCHLKHHNHSQQFWKLVEAILPDYKTSRNWLKLHGHQLRID